MQTRRPYGTVIIRQTPGGAVLDAVDPADPRLLWLDLAGITMPSADSIVHSLDARWLAVQEGRPQRTTLDRVLISQQAHQAWLALVADLVDRSPGLDPSACGEETATPQADGSLLICASLPDDPDLELRVPAGQWRWIEAS